NVGGKSPFAGLNVSGTGKVGSSGGGGGGGGGGGVGSAPGRATGGRIIASGTATGSLPAPPKPPSLNDFLTNPGGGYGGYDYGGYFGAIGGPDYSKMDNKALGGYDSVFQAQLAALEAALKGQLSDFSA